MMWLKRFQLSLVNVADAMILVPIYSILNQVMIKELAVSAHHQASLCLWLNGQPWRAKLEPRKRLGE